MAIALNTVTTHAGAPGIQGLREDLSPVLYSLTPTETPTVSNIERGKCTQVLHEWQTQDLRPAGANAKIQGDDAIYSPGTVTTRLGNRTQISGEAVVVSGTARVVDKAGRADELAFQISTKLKEVKRDIEYALLRNQAKVTGNTTTASQAASILSWLKTNTNFNATGANPVGDGSNARTDAGTTRAFTEAMLQDVLAKIFTNSSEQPNVLMVPPALKTVASAFAGNAVKNIDVTERKLTTAIDVYSGDFSTVEIIPNRFMRARDALVLRWDLWALCWLRPMKTEELAKTGDADRKQIVGEWTLEARNEAGSGGIFDLA